MDSFLFLFIIYLLHSGAAGQKPCHWGDPRVGLDTDYWNETCTPGYTFQSNGDCTVVLDSNLDPNRTSCDSFCQVKTRFFYGQEQPFVTIGILTNGTYATDKLYHQGVVGTPEVRDDTKFGHILNPGTTSGFRGITYGIGSTTLNISLNADECGYVSFVPIYRGVCGSRTFGDHCTANVTTIPNVCGTELQRSNTTNNWGANDLEVAGHAILVRTNCTTFMPLSSGQVSGQDMAYTGQVVMPSNLYQIYADYWKRFAEGAIPDAVKSNYTSCAQTKGTPKSWDCAMAVSQLLTAPNLSVTTGNTSASQELWTTVTAVGSCRIQLYFDEDWYNLPACNVSYVEVGAAAQMILDTCVDGDGYVTGTQRVRGPGQCASHVVLE